MSIPQHKRVLSLELALSLKKFLQMGLEHFFFFFYSSLGKRYELLTKSCLGQEKPSLLFQKCGLTTLWNLQQLFQFEVELADPLGKGKIQCRLDEVKRRRSNPFHWHVSISIHHTGFVYGGDILKLGLNAWYWMWRPLSDLR